MSNDRVLATYLIETPHALEHAATVLAGEQSSGTFVAVPGETPELKARFGAEVLSIEELDAVAEPSLPGAQPPSGTGDGVVYRRGRITIAFPLHNFGPSLPNLLAAVAGNLYELEELSGVRLVDLDLPEAFAASYPGPAFSIDGTRRLAEVDGRPLIGTIIKPNIGLPAAEIADLAYDLAIAGLDFIKDDELQANPASAPLAERVPAVMAALHRAADKTGRLAMYAANISGDIEPMLRGHDLVKEHGGTCVMVGVSQVGIAALSYLRARCELPIHGHRNFFGAIARHPMLGIGFSAYQKLFRIAGVDHLHVGGFNSKFYEPNDEVSRSIADCLTPLFGDDCAMPAISSAQWAGSAVDIYGSNQTTDVIHLAGGGIIGHPGGTAAGVRSMHQGWEAALSGTPLETYAAEHPELKAAIEKFGKRRS